MNKILLGYSIWSYKDWVGPFYNAEKASKLKAYSEVFKTAEIDSAFYACPSKSTVMGWLKYANMTLVISPVKPLFSLCALSDFLLLSGSLSSPCNSSAPTSTIA